jgi:hypothetical protein
MLNSKVGFGGALTAKVHRAQGPGMTWTLRNALRGSFIWGLLVNWLAAVFSKLTGVPTITAELAVRVRRADGEWIDYGVVSRRVVTDAGVAFLVDDWDDSTTDLTTFNYHGCGTGTTAENANQTALVTESTTILNPDSTRATGTKSQPAANQLRSTGTVTFDGSGAITEHGIFSQAATGGGTLWDRSVFSAINVASGDSISFQYTCTINSGS